MYPIIIYLQVTTTAPALVWVKPVEVKLWPNLLIAKLLLLLSQDWDTKVITLVTLRGQVSVLVSPVENLSHSIITLLLIPYTK